MVFDNLLSTIGGTPLIQLNRVFAALPARMFAKYESLNPGGSIKDRSALFMIRHALENREVRQGTTVIESTSGNIRIGLAQVCAYYDLPLICVIDSKTTRQNMRILQAYGARTEVVKDPDPVTGEFLPARLARVQALLQEIPNSFWPNQYANQYNALAHQHTMREIYEELDGDVDYLFCPTSTCGTLRGCVEYARQNNLKTEIVAVDAVGSVIFGRKAAKRVIPGHGAAIRPRLCDDLELARVLHVTDLECVIGCHRLLRSEAMLVGGSSGGGLMAAERMSSELLPGAVCVLIFPDRGDRYLDTVYFPEWVEKHFGQAPDRWRISGASPT